MIHELCSVIYRIHILKKWKIKKISTDSVHKRSHLFCFLKQQKILKGTHVRKRNLIKAKGNKMGKKVGKIIKMQILRL